VQPGQLPPAQPAEGGHQDQRQVAWRHPLGDGGHLVDGWVGLSYDGDIVTGWSSMARTDDEARELVGELKDQDASGSR
jgi:hypothetical protein